MLLAGLWVSLVFGAAFGAASRVGVSTALSAVLSESWCKGWCAGLRPRRGRGGRTAAEGGSLGLRGGGLPVGRGVRAGWSADMGRKEAVAFQRSLELGGAPFRRSRRCGPQVFSGKERPAFCVGGVCVGRRVATGACRACAGRAVDCSVLWWRAPVLWRGRCARLGAAGEGGAVFPCRIRVRG